MKKLSPFLLGFFLICIFQYVFNVFYYSPDSLESKNPDHVSLNLTEEDIDGIFEKPSRQMLVERGELKE